MRNGKVVVYISIAGDLLHVGHRRILKAGRKFGDILIAGVITDDGIKRYKREAIIPFEERVEMIRDYVDEVVSQPRQDPTDNLKADESIDVLVHGDDWAEDYPAFEYMRRMGKKVVRLPYYKEQSTTKIIKRILELEKR